MSENDKQPNCHFCTIYEDRPEWCRDYPWNLGNDIFEDCQFYDGEKLISTEELLKTKTQEEIEWYCCTCGKCCCYWENGEMIHKCSALAIVTMDDFLKNSKIPNRA